MKLLDVGPGFDVAFGVVLSIYLIGMLGLAIRGFMMKNNAKTSGGVQEYLNFHFLAGSNFGPLVLFLNFCAQYIGGIVMVATPNDARALGFFCLMWISGCSWCGGTFNLFSARIREVMTRRKYLSPNDYMTDRYRSTLVTAGGVLASTFQMVMITGLEWKSLGTVIHAVLGPEADHKVWVWACGLFIYMCECLGGMASVALTDAIQASLLLFAFFMMPVLCLAEWGGFAGVGDVNCQNRLTAYSFGPVAGVGSPFNVFATDECYRNSKDDIANGCAAPIPVPHRKDQKPEDVAFPLSFLTFAAQLPIPPWKNTGNGEGGTTHTFDGTEACCNYWNWTMIPEAAAVKFTSKGTPFVCENAPPPVGHCEDRDETGAYAAKPGGPFGVCPPKASIYDSTKGGNITAAHKTWSVVNGIYTASNVSAKAAGTTYSGTLTIGGVEGYTSNTMSHTQFGCGSINMGTFWHWKYQIEELTIFMFSFGFMWMPFALAPVGLHRVMTARTSDALRGSLAILHMFPITFFLPVILLGVVAGTLWPWDPTSAMPLVAFKIAGINGFGALVSVLCLVGCIASFMSTADSIIIAGSLLFTVDMWKNILHKTAEIGELLWVTKGMSFFMLITGIILATETKLDFIEMLWIGNGILGSLMPIYFGMFLHNLKSLEVFIGMIINFVVVIAFQVVRWYPTVETCELCEKHLECGFVVGKNQRLAPDLPAPLGIGDPKEAHLWMLPPFWGMIIAIPITIVLSYTLPKSAQDWFDNVQGIDESVMKKYGTERLDLDRTGAITAELMKDVTEPVKQWKAWPFLAFPFLAPLFLPWYEIPLKYQNVIGGMPEWGYAFTWINSFGTGALIIVCVFFWKGRPGELEESQARMKNIMMAPQSAEVVDKKQVDVNV